MNPSQGVSPVDYDNEHERDGVSLVDAHQRKCRHIQS